MGRLKIDNDIKKEICLYKKDNPILKNKEIQKYFQDKYQRKLSESTISEIVNQFDRYLFNFDSKNKFGIRSAAHPELEEALHMWYCEKRRLYIPISDDMLTTKAREFGNNFYGLYNVDFRCSHGWLANFKQRYGISMHTIHGEAGSVNKENIKIERSKLNELTSRYNPEDVYNLDELVLFFKMEPNKTLSSIGVAATGRKQSKERISIALCSNSTGTHRVRPLLIHKFKNPRCFKGKFDPNKLVDYYFNKKAWMTATIFSDWLTKFNKQMEKENRKVLLLVDNCNGHNIENRQLSNVLVSFLPPNMTSILQPMDAGIIKAFKGY